MVEIIDAVIDGLPDLIDEIGIAQTILLLLVALMGSMIARNRMSGKSTRSAVKEAVIPMTCAWGEFERHDLAEIKKKVEFISAEIIIVKDRLPRSGRYE